MLLKDINPFIRFADSFEYDILRKLSMTYDCRLIYILSGSGKIQINGEMQILEEGTLINFQPETPYKIIPTPSFSCVAVNYDFTDDFKNETNFFPPIPTKKFNKAFSHGTIDFTDITFLNEVVFDKNAYYARRYISELVEEFNSNKLFFREKSSLILKNMLFEIARNYKNSGKSNQLCNRVTNYIVSNYQSKITNVQIAEKLNVDPGYLNKLFKSITGKTIHKAIIEQRIKAATRLILTTDKTFEDIAYETGFYNYAHFYALFKQNVGYPPGHFRKK